MTRLFYKLCSLFASVLLFPLFYFNKRGRQNLTQRYGSWNVEISSCIWLHAASYGEVNALSPVVKLLRQKFPEYKILITCMSQTGVEKAKEMADYSFLCPFDNNIWIERAFKNIKIKALIISETEIWPAVIEYAIKKDVPVYIINARISDYSFNAYKKLSFFLKPLLNCLNKIICINQESCERFKAIGVYKELLVQGGYSKYDIQPLVKSEVEAGAIRKRFFDNSLPVITLGSIRPGEEEIWFSAVKKAKAEGLQFNLIVVPRHQEKFEYFASKLDEAGLMYLRYSKMNDAQQDPACMVILLDTMGKLSEVYSFSGLSFIGASLVNIGGHNPLEPVCYNSAICIGPYYNNVRDVVETLRNEGAITVFENSEDAYKLLKMLSEGSSVLKDTAKKAHKFWKDNYGASENIVKQIEIK